MEVPEILKGFKRYEVDEKLCKRIMFLVEEWGRSSPSVDIKQVLANSHAWLVANGEYKRDYSRFLNNWVASEERRNNDRRSVKAPPLPKPVHYEVDENEVLTGEDWKRLKESLKPRRVA